MTEQQHTGTPTDPAFWATLQARDARALMDFYVEAFGFVVTAAYEDAGVVQHAELRRPGSEGGVMLGTYRPDKQWGRAPGAATVYVAVPDVDALHQRVAAHGATITRAIADTDYGSREFGVDDPDGNSWSFGTYVGAPLPD